MPCTLSVTVDATTNIMTTLELDNGSPPATLTRCLTFELHRCTAGASSCTQPDPLVVEQDVTFTSGVSSLLLAVPCGQYTCMTVRDKLHTLRRVIEPLPDNTVEYVADFTTVAGKQLIGGNCNDDCWIDVIDFGLLAGQWNVTYDSNGDMLADGNTPCAAFSLNADISGDGIVNNADFTFIQLNIFQFGEMSCCGGTTSPVCGGAPGQTAPGGRFAGPIDRISVQQLYNLGLSDAATGDLNGDEWLDVQDIGLWMDGERPSVRPRRPVHLRPRGSRR